ncbi:MAG: hypothetical protein WAN36_08745, partial [Calditrichia bacterium]
AVTLSLIIFITPVVAVLVDFLWMGELIGFRAILGMLIIFSGILITEMETLRGYRRKRAPQANRP